MLHTYIMYPVLLFALSKIATAKKNENSFSYDELPEIAVICAAYNEEKVIIQKIESIFKTNYPKEKIRFFIGTDACSDNTVYLIKQQQKKYSQIELVEFTERTGKINIINKLAEMADAPVFIMTDANVFFTENTLHELVKPLKENNVQLTCANIQKLALNKETVTKNELGYFNFENFLKKSESDLWSVVIGVEGGCYAIKKSAFKYVPNNFTVDDFFIASEVLSNKGHILFAENAFAYEDLAADTSGEYRRKTRIATGNFQNLFYFKKILNPFSRVGFAYLSHKVLRWLTPFLFLMNLSCLAFLYSDHLIFKIIFFSEIVVLTIPLFSFILRRINIQIGALSTLNHFVMMNVALFVGFFRYCKGVESSVWQPVKR